MGNGGFKDSIYLETGFDTSLQEILPFWLSFLPLLVRPSIRLAILVGAYVIFISRPSNPYCMLYVRTYKYCSPRLAAEKIASSEVKPAGGREVERAVKRGPSPPPALKAN